ncbi:NAD(P)H-dependent oxidoreductase [Labrys wisconsinensis]|uniref:Homoserine dehydrogenase-like protein n=1 Tax=Labrys wisconsinensis TaxID=425677 RepID=A0ABU0JKU7_9HYPH|nr:homoserine dehydrogenase [Labrys wisconsinensis]MDQ0473762.1 putative homoserine dehydrogenase-like protein [Labrys wisconsinensis]
MFPSFAADLAERVRARGPIVVGLVGAGQMGTDLIVQIALMHGLRIGAVAVRTRPQNAVEAALSAGHARGDLVEASSATAVDRAIEAGRIAITTDLDALAGAGRIEVVIDATGHPESGAQVALAAIRHGKHMVMLNVEADITIGRSLKAQADKAGVIYTGAAGDEPAAAVELVAFARALGLTVVAAGKGKNNALNFDAVPEDYEAEARARDMNPRMLVEFVDGTKTMVEMVALANATGLTPDRPGMHGPRATKDELADVFRLQGEGGVLSRKGVVDYTIGKGVAPGVFCVVEPTHPRVLERLTDLHVGKGPLFTLHRPYHLTSLETPLSAARAVLYGRADMQPLDHPVAETGAVAKRDLAPGTVLGRIGERDYRGWSMVWADARKARAVPIGLAEKARVTRPVKKGELLNHENCAVDETLTIVKLRRALDQADARFLPADAA